MAQATDYNLANQSGASFRAELNTILAAVVSQNSGSTAPTTTYAYQLWIDTGASPNPLLKLRNGANSAWITIGDVTVANLGLALLASPTFTGTVTIPTATITTGVGIPLGTVSSPTIYFTGDTNTGIYSPAANQLSFTTDGTERLRLDDSGQIEAVSLGTAAAPTYTFNTDPNTGIYSPGADQVSVATGGTERLRIDSTGQIESVSLGTAAAPAYTWVGDINTGIYSPGADQVAISTNGTGRLFVRSTGKIGVGESDPAEVFEVRDGNIGLDSAGSTVGDRTTERFYKRTDNGSSNGMAAIGMNGTGTNGFLGEIKFYTGASDVFNASLSERMRLDSSGRLGLGTSSPGQLLHVANGSAWIGAATSSTSGTVGIYGDGNNGTIEVFAGNNSSTKRNLLLAPYGGNVGIGTTSPVAPLHVSNAIPTLVLDETDGTSTHAQNWLLRNGNEFQIQTRTNAGVYAGVDYAIPSSTSGATGHVWYISNAERARIDSSGRLLVGTSSSSAVSSGEEPFVQVKGTDSRGGLSLSRFSNDAQACGLYIAKSRGTSIGGATIVNDGDELGRITFAGADGVDLNTIGGRIQCFVDGSPGADDLPSRLVFSTTADGASSPTEAMRINNGQELLIGYTADNGAYKLQVNSQIFATSATIATSDGRYKENVATLGGCLDLVKALRPVSFTWKPQEDITRIDDDGNEVLVREGHNFPEGTQVGFIAQEVQTVLTDKPWLGSVIKENVRPAVKDNEGHELAPEEQFFGIAEGNLIAVLTNALQEAVAKIETLEAKVAALEAE